MYLLDTNIVSELRKARPHGGVLAWLSQVDERHLFLSAVSLGEIQAGIEITREQDAEKAAEIETWADEIIGAWNILPVGAEIFRIWARLMHRQPDFLIPDAMIAATAKAHDLRVVSRNVRDFKIFGIDALNPFTPR